MVEVTLVMVEKLITQSSSWARQTRAAFPSNAINHRRCFNILDKKKLFVFLITNWKIVESKSFDLEMNPTSTFHVATLKVQNFHLYGLIWCLPLWVLWQFPNLGLFSCCLSCCFSPQKPPFYHQSACDPFFAMSLHFEMWCNKIKSRSVL